MDFSFVDRWRARHGDAAGPVTTGSARPPAPAHPRRPLRADRDTTGLAELLAECDLLRSRAAEAGVTLDDSPASLERLDQLPPAWRERPDVQELDWLGNDAGFYLGTVLVRTVPGAVWRLVPGGGPVVRLPSGREVDVAETGRSWVESGAPELSQVYAESAEG
jgi:hypothetical protein